MSYCRWSSDDYQCDVYVYGNCFGGVSIHVANNRTPFKTDDLPNVEMGEGWDWMERYMARDKEVSKRLREAERLPIGLSRDGESFDVNGRDAIEILESLKAEGYNVPDYAIEALREEYA